MTASLPFPKKLLRFSYAYAAKRVSTYLSAVKSLSAYTFEHLLFIGGLTLIAYGVWLAWHPGGFIVGGWLAVRVALMTGGRTR